MDMMKFIIRENNGVLSCACVMIAQLTVTN